MHTSAPVVCTQGVSDPVAIESGLLSRVLCGTASPVESERLKEQLFCAELEKRWKAWARAEQELKHGRGKRKQRVARLPELLRIDPEPIPGSVLLLMYTTAARAHDADYALETIALGVGFRSDDSTIMALRRAVRRVRRGERLPPESAMSQAEYRAWEKEILANVPPIPARRRKPHWFRRDVRGLRQRLIKLAHDGSSETFE